MYRNRLADVLKGILIIFVIILHSELPGEMRTLLGFPFWVNMAVPVFMLISGYVSALSMDRIGENAVEKAYEPKRVTKKLLRFMVPFGIAFVAQWLIFRMTGRYLVGIREYGLFALVLDFLRGGKGQGSYYFPVMLQFVFIFPIIYYAIKKHRLKGLAGSFLANGIFEVLKIAFGMSDYEYRFLVFRYLFVIAGGCYIAVGGWQDVKKRTLLIGSIICTVMGLGFTCLFSYTGYSPKILIYWKDTSFVACAYLVPVLALLLSKVRIGCKPLELVGRASFNIFLVQMIYYNFVAETREWIPNVGMHMAASIVICVTIGVLFYLLECRLTKRVCESVDKIFQKED